MVGGMVDLVVTGRRVLTRGGIAPATVIVQDGRIAAIEPPSSRQATYDADDALVMPGLVDAHVHVNEPGRTEWEGFETATRAAAAGGITTIVDMPLNCQPVTTTLEALCVKRKAIAGLLSVDCAFWGGVVPGNAGELEAMIDAGVAGFKAFLVHSGIDDFPEATASDLRIAMPILARRGVPLLFHAELQSHLHEPSGARASHDAWLRSRPHDSEVAAVRLVLQLARETGCRVHIVHLSSADALDALAAARSEGVPVTVETCPHYLTFAAEDIPGGGTEYKCAPPIRERQNRERLWQGLRDGIIDQVVSDHSPCTPGLKHKDAGDFIAAWGGIASVQLALPAVWTGARQRGFGVQDLARWMCARPALLAGLSDRKGSLEVGMDADLVVWQPDASFTVEASMIHHRHKLTPYLGRRLFGVVRRTIVRGETVYDDGTFKAQGTGIQLTRGPWQTSPP